MLNKAAKVEGQCDPMIRDKKNLLIVDDDQAILYLMEKIFSGRGFQVTVARDGVEAIERLRDKRPNLVITDLQTPSLSGENLISSIRNTQRNLPIIVMTAFPNLYPETKRDKEIRAYFRKPFDIDEVIASVEKTLNEVISFP